MAQGAPFAYHDTTPGEGVSYWVEGRNGYMAARQRLMDSFAAHRIRNPVILSGDVHAFQVEDVRARPGDIESPIAATQFVTTPISSGGPCQTMVDGWLAENPDMHYGRGDRRGYLHLTVIPDAVQADMIVVDDPRRMNSAVHIAATFGVEAGRTGVAR